MSVVVIIAIIVIVLIIVSKSKNKKVSINNKRQAMPIRSTDQRITELNKELIYKIFTSLDIIIDNISIPLRESLAKEAGVGDGNLIIIGSPRDGCPVIVFTCLSEKEREYVFSDLQRSRNILTVFTEKPSSDGSYSYDAVIGNINGGQDVIIEEISKMISNKFPYAFVVVDDELNIVIDPERSTFERR